MEEIVQIDDKIAAFDKMSSEPINTWTTSQKLARRLQNFLYANKIRSTTTFVVVITGNVIICVVLRHSFCLSPHYGPFYMQMFRKLIMEILIIGQNVTIF